MNADHAETESAQLGYDRAKYGVNHQELESLGERAVKNGLASGKYGQVGSSAFSFVSLWLDDAEFVRLANSSAKRDAREAETLAIAKEANRIASEDLALAAASAAAARDEATWARWAAIIATIAALIATKDQIVALVISWLP